MHTVKRALIMAAGKGERLNPVTLDTPKPLVKVNGVRMIETSIEALKTNGINDIYIVTGYKSEQFDVLKEKYPEMYPEKEGDVILQSVYEHRQFYLTLTKQNLDHLIFQIFFKEIGRKESENEILSYGKAFFAGGYFGIIYQWILNGCVDTPDEIKMKFLGGFQYVQEQMDKKEQNES